MEWKWKILFLLTVATGVDSQEQMVQSGPELRKPGTSVKISCQASGFNIASYYMSWVQQRPGQGLEWMGWIDPDDGRTSYSKKFQGRLTLTADKSTSTLYMEMSKLTPDDTGTYFCAREPTVTIRRYFDIWGQGTTVTVSSESSSAPLLFPLVSCDSSLPDETQVTLGCLARDFLPRPVTFSWKFKNSSSISSQNIYNFPEVFTGGKYMATSQVLLPSTAILQSTDDYITCHTKHTTGEKEKKVELQVTPELPPNVSIFVPPRNSFSGNHPRTSQLICQASGFSPRTIVMSWLQRGEPVQPSLVSTSAVEAEPKGSGPTTFRVISRLTITENEWLSQREFTCQALHKGLTFQKNVSSVCMGDDTSTGISVFLLPPTFANIFLTQSAQLTCLVTGLATYDSLDISWSRQNGEALQTHVNISESHPNSTFTAKGHASVCREEWESGEKFTCTVQHSDLPSPLKQSLSRPKDVAKHPPSVFVLPPAQEQLKLRESASITCP